MNIVLNEYNGKNSIAHGRIVTFDLSMDTYEDKRTRTIRVWLPEGYDGRRRFPVLYMHDAQNLFDGFDDRYKWYVNREMKALEKEGLPAIIVGVDTAATRISELCPDMPINPDIFLRLNLPEKISPSGNLYAEFITNQLKPIIDETFMTLPDAANTAIGGSSMGGLMSLFIILKYPDIYSKAMVFSPYFKALHKQDILSKLELYDYARVQRSRIYIFHGGLDQIDDDNWPCVRHVYETMRDKGMDDTQLALVYDSRQPHFESAWQKYFAEAYRYLFAPDNEAIKWNSKKD